MFNLVNTLIIVSTFSLWINQQTGAQLTLDQISLLANKDDDVHLNRTMSHILIPRVVGTPGHEDVRRYISDELRNMNFHVEFDEFVDKVPILGNLKFTNVIGYLNPHADRYLALACHFDSKYFPDSDTFIAATDSGVPCSLMLNIVKTTNYALQKIRNDISLSLMLIFFDGEEAFEEWSRHDSTYGARHLAEKWSKVDYINSKGELTKKINRIEMMMLLDLMGAAQPTFQNFFDDTSPAYYRLNNLEDNLRKSGLLRREEPDQMFVDNTGTSHIEDDHIPFLERDIPILHLIVTPFPHGWHTLEDNLESLNYNTISNLNKILRVFTLDYLLNCSYRYKAEFCVQK